jgi:hypothetical protein
MFKLTLLLTIALVMSAPAFALGDKVPAPVRLDTDVIHSLVTDVADDCLVGNPNGVYFAIPDWIWGAEIYTYLFDPMDTCDCAAGLEVQTLHMIVQFGAEDVPATFDVFVDIGAAVWDDASGCWQPGPATCSTEINQITVENAGLYDIAVSVDDCACMEMVHQYSISYNFVTAFSSNPDIVTDQFPSSCTSWNDYGLGWFDLVEDFGYPGNLLMWADSECCESPVGNADASWGGVKSLYR